MFGPITYIQNFKSALVWVDLAISLILIIGVLFLVMTVMKHKVFTIITLVVSIICLLAWVLVFHFCGHYL